MPKVASIIVPARNSGRVLDDCLASLLAQDYPRDGYEIIVVDDGSDRALAVPGGVRLVRHPSCRGLNAARNTGIHESVGELLIFVDDDIEAPPGWLLAFIRAAAERPDVWCFGGRITLRLEGPYPRLCGRCPISESKLDLGGDVREIEGRIFGGNMLIRREAFEVVGQFSEAQPIYYDEIEWQERLRRLGQPTVYVPDACLVHRRSAEQLRLRRLLGRRYRFGYGFAAFRESQGRPVALSEPVRKMPRLLAHAVVHRCTFGLLASAEALGTARRILESVRR